VPLTASAAAAVRKHCGGARVLLAEDNPVNQMVATELLQGAGLVVDVAANGVEAIEFARRRRHDLILMDVHMPQIDGLEATRRIRRLPGRQHTPVIALTAGVLTEDRAACLSAGMTDYLAKPIDPSELYAAVLRALQPAVLASTARPPHGMAEPVSDDPSSAADDLARLQAMLASGDVEALDLTRRSAAALRARLGAKAALFGNLVRAYDFERALELLRAATGGGDAPPA
jgi:two-component system sensor histidine kinase/response regulator